VNRSKPKKLSFYYLPK